jgi:threonine dehydrogenase-like Zn-dependent dehydrogenase
VREDRFDLRCGPSNTVLARHLRRHHHGARDVVVIDPNPQRRAAAEGLGLTALDPEDADPALVLKSRWRSGPGDRGAEVVFQCRGRAAALALALRLLRPQATVIDLAFYTDNGTALRLGAEFHHNGLGIRCAQIGRVPRGTTAVPITTAVAAVVASREPT